MTERDLEAIEARANAATEGPWSRTPAIAITSKARDVIRGIVGLHWTGDLEFIAHARTDVPALVAEVRRLQADHTDSEKALIDSLHKALDERDALRLENEELRKMTAGGPFVPLHQYEKLQHQYEELQKERDALQEELVELRATLQNVASYHHD